MRLIAPADLHKANETTASEPASKTLERESRSFSAEEPEVVVVDTDWEESLEKAFDAIRDATRQGKKLGEYEIFIFNRCYSWNRLIFLLRFP